LERTLKYGPSSASFVFVVSAVISIVVQAMLIGKLVDRFGEGRIAIVGLVCAIGAYASVPYITSTATLVAVVIFWALSGALLRPAMSSLISHAAPSEMRGALFGVNDSLGNLAFVVAPLAASAILERNYHAVGLLPMAAAIVALAIGYRMFSSPTASVEAAPAGDPT